MGFKRTFVSEDELNVKHARQISYSNKLAKLDEGVPYHVSLDKSDVVIGEDLSDLYQDKEGYDTNAPFSWNTYGSEDESVSGATTLSTLSHESPESDDVDWCQMSPRKLVPIGSGHQADIPECLNEEASELKVTGECVIPMPDCETEAFKIGKGRKECTCLDKGSIRCVQQHISENRESLFETIGYERCLEIGLCEMGEEVAGKLSEDEEDLFHKIVYSNPASLDRDFWKHLKSEFPSRTSKEIVSYYFNVFIIRRRAVQNRSKSLDVDSDDDEWQVEYDNTLYGVETSDEVNVEDDSCMSYEFQDSLFNDLVDLPFSFDPCDSIFPDHCWTKNIDLLPPTSNIIDEIFGQGPLG